jgi:flagellar hook-length control protein FliK
LLSCQEKGHTVSVTVQAENQMACSLLQRQEDTVRTLLAEGGYELGRFEVGGWSGPQQEASGKQQRGQMFESDEDFLGEDLKRRNEGLGGSAKPVGASSMGAGRFWAVA